MPFWKYRNELEMKNIDIIIPTRNRLKKLQRCLKSIPRQIPDVTVSVIVICDGDIKTALRLTAMSDGVVNRIIFVQDHSGSVFCRNLATQCAEDAVLYATDDIEFKSNAIEMAIKSMKKNFPDEDGIIGFSQISGGGFSPAGVALVGQPFLQRYPNRKLFCPLYFHFSCQEIERLGKKLGKLVLEKDAVLAHYHPNWNKEEFDKTHSEARVYRKKDRLISSDRRAKKIIWGSNE